MDDFDEALGLGLAGLILLTPFVSVLWFLAQSLLFEPTPTRFEVHCELKGGEVVVVNNKTTCARDTL